MSQLFFSGSPQLLKIFWADTECPLLSPGGMHRSPGDSPHPRQTIPVELLYRISQSIMVVWGHVGMWGALWTEESIASECLICLEANSPIGCWGPYSHVIDVGSQHACLHLSGSNKLAPVHGLHMVSPQPSLCSPCGSSLASRSYSSRPFLLRDGQSL